MWRTVILFILISFVVVPIVIQQTSQLKLASQGSGDSDKILVKREDQRPKPDDVITSPIASHQTAPNVSAESALSLNPFRRKIMSDISFNTLLLPIGNPVNSSNATEKIDIVAVNVTRVKDLKPPPTTNGTSTTSTSTTPTSASTTGMTSATTTTVLPLATTTPIALVTASATTMATASTGTQANSVTRSATISSTSTPATSTIVSAATTPVSVEGMRRKSLLDRFVIDSHHGLNASSAECQKQLDQTDACFRTVMLIDDKYMVPKTFSDLDSTYCKNMNVTLKCLGGYGRCLNKIPRILYNFLYLQVKKIINDICRKELFREDILYHGRCFQLGDLRMIRGIVDRGTLTSLYVLKHVPTVNIIPWGCCGFQKMFHEGKKRVDDLCWNRTGNQTGEFVMNFMKSAASDLLDIGCRKYSSMDQCNKNLPEAMKIFDDLTSSEIPMQKYSPIIPLVEISRRMSNSGE